MTERVWQNGMCSCGFFMYKISLFPVERVAYEFNLLLRSTVWGDQTADDDDRGNELARRSCDKDSYLD